MSVRLKVPWVLDDAYSEVSVGLLEEYFGREGQPRYSGAYFQEVGGRGDGEHVKDVIRTEDALAVNALSVSVPARAACRLLSAGIASAVTDLLRDIPPDVHLVEDRADVSEMSPAWQLWDLLRDKQRVGLGPTTTSKLMARKRPRLIPIYDSVIAAVLGLPDSRGHWAGMQELTRVKGNALHEHAKRLTERTGLDERVEPLERSTSFCGCMAPIQHGAAVSPTNMAWRCQTSRTRRALESA